MITCVAVHYMHQLSAKIGDGMSKYIIEIAEEYEEYFKGVLICGIADGKFAVDVIAREDIEELNSDYINEHYGELQDEAYQRGLEDGKWKAEDGCDGCKYYEDTSLTNPCSECSRGHVDRYEPLSDPDRIEVGDIVDRYIDGKFDSRGIYLGGNGEIWDCLFWANTLPITLAYPKGQFKKTGKHYDIQSILEAMRT